MHKPLNIAERAKLQIAEPVEVKPPMTRRDKLLRLAEVARRGRPSILKNALARIGLWGETYENQWYIFHRIEYVRPVEALENYFSILSVFDAALKDPVLYDAGLRPDQGKSVSVLRAMQFFELTQAQMHPLSCDCGGLITNAEMAFHIEKMAG